MSEPLVKAIMTDYYDEKIKIIENAIRSVDFGKGVGEWKDEHHNKCMTYSYLGGLYLHENRPDDAKTILIEAIKTGNAHAQTYEFLGTSYTRLAKENSNPGFYKLAIWNFEKALKMKSSFDATNSYDLFGYAYYKDGKIEESIKMFEIAVKNDPKNFRYQSNLIVANAKLKYP